MFSSFLKHRVSSPTQTIDWINCFVCIIYQRGRTSSLSPLTAPLCSLHFGYYEQRGYEKTLQPTHYPATASGRAQCSSWALFSLAPVLVPRLPPGTVHYLCTASHKMALAVCILEALFAPVPSLSRGSSSPVYETSLLSAAETPFNTCSSFVDAQTYFVHQRSIALLKNIPLSKPYSFHSPGSRLHMINQQIIQHQPQQYALHSQQRVQVCPIEQLLQLCRLLHCSHMPSHLKQTHVTEIILQ